MALIDKKAFAAMCSMNTKKLSVYISRKAAIAFADGMLDTKDPRNAAFITKWGGINILEIEEVKHVAQIKPKAPVKPSSNDEESEEENEWANLDIRKKRADVEKKEADLERVRMGNKAMKGDLIPFELIKPLIRQNNQSLTTEFKNGADELILNISKKKQLSGTELAELNAILLRIINTSIQKATEQTIRGLAVLIKDYKLNAKV